MWLGKENWLKGDTRELFDIMEMFYTLTVIIVTWVYKFSKFTEMYAENGYIFVCKLYFNKVDFLNRSF